MKTLWSIVGSVLWGLTLGLAAVVVSWFTVSLIRVCWQVPFGIHPGQLIGALRGVASDPLPDAAGWLLIASFIVASVALSRARDRFIADLAAAIGKQMPNPSDYVHDVRVVEDDSEKE